MVISSYVISFVITSQKLRPTISLGKKTKPWHWGMGISDLFPLMLGWEVLIDQPKSGTFFHCDCPWGGELLKIRVEVSVSRELGALGELVGVSDPIS